MALHRLTHIVMGVPNVEATAAYYAEFGLIPGVADQAVPAGRTFATVDGGEQLTIVQSPQRRLVRLGIGVDDPDDLDRISASLAALGVPAGRNEISVRAEDPGTRVTVRVEIAARVAHEPTPAPVFNAPGVTARTDERAPGILRDRPVRPRKLGHVVLGSTDREASQRFFTRGIGLKVSDEVPGIAAFLRCSTDHHNVLVQQAPVAFLHHTSWQVDDVDEVGRGASAMLEADPSRHTWGLGRHFIGSNFFWYLKDPAGNFSEYYSDLDCIVDDALWKPGGVGGRPVALGLGAAAARVVPRPRRPRRADGRRAPGAMMPVPPIWRPDPAVVATSAIAGFGRFVTDRTGAEFGQYLDLWRWSVDHLDEFWRAVWDFYDVMADGSHQVALAESAAMPGARWFPGTRLNYAEHALRHRPGDDDAVAVTAVSEDGITSQTTWAQLRAQVAALAQWLRDVGVQRGDRVVGYLPDTTPTLVAFLAAASVGAIWSACAQDYGADGAAARFAQLEPVVLFAADGYRWNGRVRDRRDEVAALQRALPTLRATVRISNVGLPTAAEPTEAEPDGNSNELTWEAATARPAELRFDRVDFDAPLWMLFSSGTTGLPKGIVHGHGGVLLEHYKLLGLHLDAGPGRSVFWYTTTNWIMWNIVASALLVGAPIVLYDGSPGYPDAGRLWQIAADHRVAVLGVSPGYLLACAKAGLRPGRDLDLGRLRTLGSTGSPLHRRRPTTGCTTTSAPGSRSRRRAAAPTWPAGSPAAPRPPRSGRARSPPPTSASRWRPGTTPASR